MGLRTRLSVLVVTLFVIVCAVAGIYVVNDARRAVAEEIHSTAALTMDLLEAELVRGGSAGDERRMGLFLDRLATLESTRNMSIVIRKREGGRILAALEARPGTAHAVPAWYARLVAPADLTVRRTLQERGMPELVMELRNAAFDELAESWRETRGVLLMMVAFAALVMGTIFHALGRDLAPIASILKGLEGIEKGEYEQRLPAYATSELRRISDSFNHMAQVLMESRAENRRLRQRSIDIQEQERRLIARELHDELGQSLTAIKALAVATGAAVPEVNRVRAGLDEVARIADHTYDVARQMMQRLRPAVLDVIGLDAALQDFVDRWNGGNGGMFCSLTMSGPVAALAEPVRIAIYRIVQEALTNVARHAGGERVDIVLVASEDGSVRLDVGDDGQGFDAAGVRPGLGLLGMRERVEALGGVFTLQATPGTGTRMAIELPPRGANA